MLVLQLQIRYLLTLEWIVASTNLYLDYKMDFKTYFSDSAVPDGLRYKEYRGGIPKGTSSCIGVLPGHWKLGFWIADLYHCLLKSTGFYMFVYLFFHYDSCFSVRRTK